MSLTRSYSNDKRLQTGHQILKKGNIKWCILKMIFIQQEAFIHVPIVWSLNYAYYVIVRDRNLL